MALARLLARVHRPSNGEIKRRVEEHEVRLDGIDRQMDKVKDQLVKIEERDDP